MLSMTNGNTPKKKSRISGTSLYLALFFIFLLMANVTLGIFLTKESGDAMKTLINNRMLDISNTAASLLDGDVLGTLTAEDINTPGYRKILETLTHYQDNIDLKYIYCIKDNGNKEFVFSVDPTVDDPGEFGSPIVYTDALYAASLGTPSVDQEPYSDQWGRFYSAYSPVFDSNGKVAGIVAVDFSADWFEDQILSHIRTTAIISFLSIVVGTLIVLLISSNFRRRFRLLYSELNSLSEGIETLANELSSGVEMENNRMLHEDDAMDSSNDDITVIGNKIRRLQDYMSAQISFVRSKAYTDGLTGLGNRTSYLDRVREIDEKIESGSADFLVAMFDINGLKDINDRQGHERGDEIIVEAADNLRNTFGDENVFRIGGDEFVVLLNEPQSDTEETLREFIPHIEISKGYARFDRESDKSYIDTFNRADSEMYSDKREYYRTHKGRRNSD